MSCDFIRSKKLSEFCKSNFDGVRIPLECGIELTNLCNLNCVHCYIDRSQKKELPTQIIYNFIDQLYDLGCMTILFTGGEVFTRKDFLDIYKYTRLKGISVVVLSNLTLIDDEIASTFDEYPITYFSTTMYGYTKNVYERITGIRGSYEKFLHGIEILKKYKINFELKSIALTLNKEEILDIAKFAKELNVPFRYSTNIRVKNDLDNKNLSFRLTPEEAFWFDKNDPERKKFWAQVARSPKPQKFCEMRKKQKNKFLCHAGEQSLWIQANGLLHACSKEVINGFDLLQNSIKDGWENFLPAIINGKIEEKNYYCLKCIYFRYCEQCFAEIDAENIYSNLPYSFNCQVAKLRFEYCMNIKNNEANFNSKIGKT